MEYWILGNKYSQIIGCDSTTCGFKFNKFKYLNTSSGLFSDINSFLKLTYCIDFPKILTTNIVSDIGWGCMIRSGQMMVAKAMIIAKFGKKWKYSSTDEDLRSIANMFGDRRSAVLSIHNICEIGSYMGTKIGSWFSPTITADSIKLLNNEEQTSPIYIIVFKNGIIDMDSVFDKIDEGVSVLLMIPLMLGLNSICSNYKQAIFDMFRSNLFCGIVGGKPNVSMYFIGYSERNLLCINPHDVKVYREVIDYETLNCCDTEFMDIDCMDPSMIFGFILKTKEDANEFQDYIKKLSTQYEFPLCIGKPITVSKIGCQSDGEWEMIVNQ